MTNDNQSDESPTDESDLDVFYMEEFGVLHLKCTQAGFDRLCGLLLSDPSLQEYDVSKIRHIQIQRISLPREPDPNEVVRDRIALVGCATLAIVVILSVYLLGGWLTGR